MSVEAHKEKQVIIDEIKDKFERAASAVVIDYIGITVAEADAMRKKLREANVDYTIYKNTMAKRAIAGTDYEKLSEVLTGPSAFAFSYDDATAPARVLNDAIKEFKKMEFKAGIVENEFYDAEGLKTIASIPGRDVLIAKFMGSIQSPVSKFVRTLQAVADEKPADGEAPAEAPAEEAAPAEAPAEEAPAEAPAEEAAEAAAEEAPAEEAAEAEEAPAEEKTEE